MYIDNHVHCNPDDFRGDPKAFVAGCRDRGVEHMLVIETLRRCQRVVEMFGDFMVPIAVINMDTAGPNDIGECIDAGCRGIKFIAAQYPYGHERYWPLYAKLVELGKPAVFHSAYLAPLYLWDLESPEHPVWTEHMRPMQVEVVSRRFPQLQIVIAHYGNPGSRRLEGHVVEGERLRRPLRRHRYPSLHSLLGRSLGPRRRAFQGRRRQAVLWFRHVRASG